MAEILSTQKALNDAVASTDLSIQQAVNKIADALYAGTITSPITVPTITLGSEKLTDGGLEVWTNPTTLTNWTFGAIGESNTEALAREATEIHGGTYSAKLTSGTAGVAGYIYQAVSNDDEFPECKITLWAKNGTGVGRFGILDRTPGEEGVLGYNFTGASAGTYTSISGGLSADQITTLTAVAYTQFTLDNIPQSSETTKIVPIVVSPGTDGQTCYVDDLSVKLYERASVTLFNNVSPEDVTDLLAIDTVEIIELEGGSGFIVREIDGGGTYKTDFETFDFSNNGINSKATEVTMAGSVPTHTELETAFGVTAIGDLGAGFLATIQKAGSTETFIVATYGGDIYYTAMTKAVDGE